MSGSSPSNNPIQWFVHACVLLLIGTVALTVAIHLLQAIWPWLLGIALLAGAIMVSVVVWRIRRRPW
jgi:uncharacterized membrane protein YgdD (TMEM256/DUF423 family)